MTHELSVSVVVDVLIGVGTGVTGGALALGVGTGGCGVVLNKGYVCLVAA